MQEEVVQSRVQTMMLMVNHHLFVEENWLYIDLNINFPF